MKPLTKIAMNRGGGIAARFASPTKIAVDTTTTTTDTVRTTAKKLAKQKKHGLLNDTAAPTRYERWREANPDLYKQRQAAYMRDKRQKERGK